MLIHFVHTGSAYLPELGAYVEHLALTGNHAQVHYRIDTVPRNAEVVWWMCGLVDSNARRCFPRAFHIHEYASASVGSLCHLKDVYKRWVQPKPDYRIFQNKWVHARLGFGDTLQFEYRDMGVSPHFFADESQSSTTEFDFVYAGEMNRLRCFRPFFDGLAQTHRKTLLVGHLPDALRSYFDAQRNVTAVGRVSYAEVPAYLNRARYGLNLVPNQLPYTEQTSTKLLEYCAAGLRILSTDYAWVREFEQHHRASFAYITVRNNANAYTEFLDSSLEFCSFLTPKLHNLQWPRLLNRMQVWQRLGVPAKS